MSKESKKKPYIHECDVCNRKFKSKSHLKEHYMTHTGIFPFNCQFCGKGFRRESAFQRHQCAYLKERNPLESPSDKSQEEEKTFLDEFQKSMEREDEEEMKAEGKYNAANKKCNILGLIFEGRLKLFSEIAVWFKVL